MIGVRDGINLFNHKTLDDIDKRVKDTIDSLAIVMVLIKEEWNRIQDEKEIIQNQQESLKHFKTELQQEREKWARDSKNTEMFNLQMMDQVHLNVGGEHFTTTTSTLCSIEGTMLSAMFSGRHSLSRDNEGRHFIDRDPQYFKVILNYLRDTNSPSHIITLNCVLVSWKNLTIFDTSQSLGHGFRQFNDQSLEIVRNACFHTLVSYEKAVDLQNLTVILGINDQKLTGQWMVGVVERECYCRVRKIGWLMCGMLRRGSVYRHFLGVWVN